MALDTGVDIIRIYNTANALKHGILQLDFRVLWREESVWLMLLST